MSEDIEIPQELLEQLEKEGVLDEILKEDEEVPEEKKSKKASKPKRPVGRPRLTPEEKAERAKTRQTKPRVPRPVEVKINLEDVQQQAAKYFKSEMERRLAQAKAKVKSEPEAKPAEPVAPPPTPQPAPAQPAPAQPISLPPLQPLPLARTMTGMPAPPQRKKIGVYKS